MSGMSILLRFRLWIMTIIFPEYAAAELELRELHDKYGQLILAVANKYPDETRHETALRYIQEREQRVSGPSKEKR